MTDENAELARVRHNAVIEAIGELKMDIKGTNERLDRLNDRTRTVEAKVAVLEDRSPGRQGGIWGAIGGALAGFATGLMRQ